MTSQSQPWLRRTPSVLNEVMVAAMVYVNFGAVALGNPGTGPLWAMLGVLTALVAWRVGTSARPLSERQRGQWLIALPVTIIALTWMAKSMGVEVRDVLPTLMLLSCFALLLVSLKAPSPGIAWAFIPSLPSFMIVATLSAMGSDAGFLPWMGVGAANALVGVWLGFTSGPASRRPHAPLVYPAVRMLLGSVVLALVVAAPLTAARLAFQDLEHPSLPGLPPISTSSAVVFKARFEGPAPSHPYWEYSDPYVWPISESEWVPLKELEKAYHDRSSVVSMVRTPSAQVWDTSVAALSPMMADELASYRLEALDDREFSYYQQILGSEFFLASLEGSLGWRIQNDAPPPGLTLEVSSLQSFHRPSTQGLTKPLETLYLSIPDASTVVYWPEEVDRSGLSAMPQTHALVSSWMDEGLEGQALVDRALEHFSENLAYHFDHQSTDPKRNGVDHFLFAEQKGVCRHFSNAFAMMMRMGGIPSRLVGGYAGGEFDPESNTWNVRKRDAHIWVQVWLGERGWVSVDPTAVVPVEKGVPENALAWHWGGQAPMANVVAPAKFSTAGAVGDASDGSSFTLGAPSLPPMPTALAVLLALVVLGTLGWVGVRRGWFARSPQAPEDRAWGWVKDYLTRRGFDLPVSAGPATVGSVVAPQLPEPVRTTWLEVVSEYERWKFAGEESKGLPRRLRAAARAVGRVAPTSKKPRFHD